MPDKKYTVDEVSSIVENEGLGYAVQDYMSSERIEDPKLAKLWEEAKYALDKIDFYLENHTEPL